MANNRFFDIIEGTDGRFRIALAEKYARKFATAVGGLFVSPGYQDRETAERIGWNYIKEANSLKELRRSAADVAAERQLAEAAQTSLF